MVRDGYGSSAGCFGKLPQLDDFVTRELGPEFVQPWDGWLRRAMAESQSALGGDWLEVFVTSPIWNFFIGPGPIGRDGYAGVMCPSVDLQGSCYPITLAAPAVLSMQPVREDRDKPETPDPLAPPTDWDGWFARATNMVRAVVEERLDPDSFFAILEVLGRPPIQGIHPGIRLDEETGLTPSTLATLMLASPVGIWWTDGSELVHPSTVLCPGGFPASSAFTAFLDGDWHAHGWNPHSAASMPITPDTRSSLGGAR